MKHSKAILAALAVLGLVGAVGMPAGGLPAAAKERVVAKAAKKQIYRFTVKSAKVLTAARLLGQPPPGGCPLSWELAELAQKPAGDQLSLKPESGSAKFTVTGAGNNAQAKGKVTLVLQVPFDDTGVVTQYTDAPYGDCTVPHPIDCGPAFTSTANATISITKIGAKGGPRVLYDPGYEGSAEPDEFLVAPPMSCSGFGQTASADIDTPREYCDTKQPQDLKYDAADVMEGTLTVGAICHSLGTSYPQTDDQGRPVRETSSASLELKLKAKR